MARKSGGDGCPGGGWLLTLLRSGAENGADSKRTASRPGERLSARKHDAGHAGPGVVVLVPVLGGWAAVTLCHHTPPHHRARHGRGMAIDETPLSALLSLVRSSPSMACLAKMSYRVILSSAPWVPGSGCTTPGMSARCRSLIWICTTSETKDASCKARRSLGECLVMRSASPSAGAARRAGGLSCETGRSSTKHFSVD